MVVMVYIIHNVCEMCTSQQPSFDRKLCYSCVYYRFTLPAFGKDFKSFVSSPVTLNTVDQGYVLQPTQRGSLKPNLRHSFALICDFNPTGCAQPIPKYPTVKKGEGRELFLPKQPGKFKTKLASHLFVLVCGFDPTLYDQPLSKYPTIKVWRLEVCLANPPWKFKIKLTPLVFTWFVYFIPSFVLDPFLSYPTINVGEGKLYFPNPPWKFKTKRAIFFLLVCDFVLPFVLNPFPSIQQSKQVRD